MTTTDDTDGTVCDTPCSLRQAINAANLNAPAHDVIIFAIPGPGTHAITPGVPVPIVPPSTLELPPISDAVTIDGRTEVGIGIVGPSPTVPGENGLHVLPGGSGSVIVGLEIRGFAASGILIEGAHDTMIGGTSAGDGNVIAGNGNDGVTVMGDATAIDNRILGDRIVDNGDAGIDLGDHGQSGVGCPVGGEAPGPNGFQCAPTFSFPADPSLGVTVHALAPVGSTSARAEIFWSATCPFDPTNLGFGTRADVFLGSIDVPLSNIVGGAAGSADFTFPAPNTTGFLTASVTGPNGTSDFATCAPIPVPSNEQIAVTAAPLLATVGQWATIALRVTNLGPFDDAAVLGGLDLSAIPATISATSSQGSCPPAFLPSVVCVLGGLPAGASAAITVQFKPSANGTYSAAAYVASLGNDPDPANDTVTVPITVGGETTSADPVVSSGGTHPAVQVTFASITHDGTTTITTSDTDPALPGGFQLVGLPFVDIQTTADHSGSVTVCLSYAGADTRPTDMFHFESGAWHTVVPITVEEGNERICGTTTSLSPFVLVYRTPVPPTVVVPSNIVTAATGPAGAAVSYVATATDYRGFAIVPTCSRASGSTFAIGTTTVTCSATDSVGTTEMLFNVTVGYAFTSFYQPLNDPITIGNPKSVFKGGSTIAVKFSLAYANGSLVSDSVATAIAAACGATISLTQTPGNAPNVDEVVSSTTANVGACFRYDPSADQFIFNLGTKTYPAPSLYLLAAAVKGTDSTILASHTLGIGLR